MPNVPRVWRQSHKRDPTATILRDKRRASATCRGEHCVHPRLWVPNPRTACCRRDAHRPRFENLPPGKRRRESRLLGAPAASCASETGTGASHHSYAGTSRPSLRNGFNGLSRERRISRSPRATGLIAPSPCTAYEGPAWRCCLAERDRNVGGSGSQDIAVREKRPSSSDANVQLQSHSRRDRMGVRFQSVSP